MRLPPPLPKAEMPLERIEAMYALDVLARRAYETEDDRLMATVAHAWTLVGFAPFTFTDTLPDTHGVYERAERGAKGRPYRLIRAQALGMLHTLAVLMLGDRPLSRRALHNAHHMPHGDECMRYVILDSGGRRYCLLDAGHDGECVGVLDDGVGSLASAGAGAATGDH